MTDIQLEQVLPGDIERRSLRSYRRNCPYGGFIWSLKMKWLSRGPSTPRRILTMHKTWYFPVRQ